MNESAGAGARAQEPAGQKPDVKIEEGQINGAGFEIRRGGPSGPH